jgi:hypothetical protein
MKEELFKCQTRESATEFLAMQSSDNLKRLAKELSIRSQGSRGNLIERIVENTIGSELSRKAIRGEK